MRRPCILVALVSGALAAAIALSTVPAASASAPSVQRLTITIALGDQEALPANFAVRPGVPVVVTFRNYTHSFHTFAIRALGVSVLIAPAKGGAPAVTRARFTVPEYGVYTWSCLICASGAHARMHAMTGRIYSIVTGP